MTRPTRLVRILHALSRPRAVRVVCPECHCTHKEDRHG